MYRVFKAPKFQKNIEKLLSKKELDELNIFIENLKTGNIMGKPLGYDFFREKKIGGKRVYFLIYNEIAIILLVNASNKKYQQETIDEIKLLLTEFKRYAYELHDMLVSILFFGSRKVYKFKLTYLICKKNDTN